MTEDYSITRNADKPIVWEVELETKIEENLDSQGIKKIGERRVKEGKDK